MKWRVVEQGFNIPTYAIKGEDNDTYYTHLGAALGSQAADDDGRRCGPGDDAADEAHGFGEERDCRNGRDDDRRDSASRDGEGRTLKYPVIAVNDAQTKHFFDNRYGTGQSTLGRVIRATNLLLAGLKVVIAGYGWCGRGIAMAREGIGRGCDRHGNRSGEGNRSGDGRLPRDAMGEAAKEGDVFITVTGNKNVIAQSTSST